MEGGREEKDVPSAVELEEGDDTLGINQIDEGIKGRREDGKEGEREGGREGGREGDVPLAVEFLEEGYDGLGVNEIDEGVADVALVLEVDGQVEEVVFPLVRGVDLV